MTTKKKAFAGGTGSGSTTAFPALLTTATDPLKGLILHASSGIGATSADVVPGQPAGAVGQVSGADTGVAWQPAGGGLSQPQIVQPGVTTPAVSSNDWMIAPANNTQETGSDMPQQSTALDVPSTLQVPSKQPASTLQGRSQVKAKPNQSKACSKEGVVPCSAYEEWIGDKEGCTAEEYARARGGE